MTCFGPHADEARVRMFVEGGSRALRLGRRPRGEVQTWLLCGPRRGGADGGLSSVHRQREGLSLQRTLHASAPRPPACRLRAQGRGHLDDDPHEAGGRGRGRHPMRRAPDRFGSGPRRTGSWRGRSRRGGGALHRGAARSRPLHGWLHHERGNDPPAHPARGELLYPSRQRLRPGRWHPNGRRRWRACDSHGRGFHQHRALSAPRA